MKKLTPEEKEQRRLDRIQDDKEMSERAPQWNIHSIAPADSYILKPGDSVWIKSDQGFDHCIEVEIRRPATVSGVLIDTVQFHMDAEGWAQLADAAIRRARAGRARIDELDPARSAATEAATLRDRFAMAALNGYLTGSYMGDANEGLGNFGDPCFPEAARAAYNYADAMMEARRTPGASTPPETPKESGL
jgi:hypothetical protein